MRILVQLTENDKRFLIAFFLAVILIFVFIGYIGYWITRIMDVQGRRLDSKCYDVVMTRVITDKKHFKKYARKKSWQMFYKEAQIPMIIMIAAGLCILLHFLINGFNVNLFDSKKGFSTMLFLWNYNDPDLYQEFFGMKLLAKWPELYSDIGKPQFVWCAVPSYFGVIGGSVGVLWYLVAVQAEIARELRIRKLGDSVFDKSLEGFNQNNQMAGMMMNQQMPQPMVQPQPLPPQNLQPPVQPQPQPVEQKEEKKGFFSRFFK